jgi:acetyltransferase-like isoleucine patch superfamily enzyme
MAASICEVGVEDEMGRESAAITNLRRKGADIGKNVTIHKSARIKAKQIQIGDGVYIGPKTRIVARKLLLKPAVRIGKECTLRSQRIEIGEFSQIGDENDIQPFALFSMGDTSYIRSQAHIRGRTVSLGDEVFITDRFRVGGGGRNGPEAHLTIGDRCTMHNNFINIARPVTVGNDVGFSPDTILITHGYWQSVLEGYSATYAPITIRDWVILGMRVIVLPGVEIGEGTTVGAGSIVTKTLPARCVAVGVPARVIKTNYPSPPSEEKQDIIMTEILRDYSTLLSDKGFALEIIEFERGILLKLLENRAQTNLAYFRGPQIPPEAFSGGENILLTFEGKPSQATTVMNLRTLKIQGQINSLVQDLRDFLRRYGIRFYGYGLFQSIPPQISLSLDEEDQE